MKGLIVALIFFLGGFLSFPLVSGVAEEFQFEKPDSITIIFGGDMLFDRHIRKISEEKGWKHIFSCINPFLKEADFVIGNLEGPITNFPSKSVGTVPGGEGNYTFTFSTTTAEVLFDNNIRLVNLDNNHIFNFGREGLKQTLVFLDGAKVDYFGNPQNFEPFYFIKGNIQLAFISFSEFNNIPLEFVLEQILEARNLKYLPIVYTHWGNEYEEVSERVIEIAHKIIDTGAELVIGSHPHVIQKHEVYKNKNIYYSLGNFIFDQYWNQEVSTGLLLKVVFDNTRIKNIEENFIRLFSDGRTCLKL